MERREKVLLDNDVLLAAVYDDPLYRVTLNDQEHAKGKTALLEIALAMKNHKERTRRSGVDLCEVRNEGNLEENFSSTSEDEDFEKILDRQAKRGKTETFNLSTSSPLQLFKTDFNNALPNMEKIDRSSKMSVMNAIPLYPAILQDVAYAVTALPPTQVSVERLFSALRIIRSDLRTSMKEDLLEAILFLRTNGF